MISILKKIVEDKRKRVNSLKASKPIDLKNIDNLLKLLYPFIVNLECMFLYPPNAYSDLSETDV